MKLILFLFFEFRAWREQILLFRRIARTRLFCPLIFFNSSDATVFFAVSMVFPSGKVIFFS